MKTTTYNLVDPDNNVYQCDACNALHQFEADGPFENSFQVCPYCGRVIA